MSTVSVYYLYSRVVIQFIFTSYCGQHMRSEMFLFWSFSTINDEQNSILYLCMHYLVISCIPPHRSKLVRLVR